MLEVSTTLVLNSVELDTVEDDVEFSELVAVEKVPVPDPVLVGPPGPVLKEYG